MNSILNISGPLLVESASNWIYVWTPMLAAGQLPSMRAGMRKRKKGPPKAWFMAADGVVRMRSEPAISGGSRS